MGKRGTIAEIIRSCLWVGFWVGFGYTVVYWTSLYAKWLWQPQLGEILGSAMAVGIWVLTALSIWAIVLIAKGQVRKGGALLMLTLAVTCAFASWFFDPNVAERRLINAEQGVWADEYLRGFREVIEEAALMQRGLTEEEIAQLLIRRNTPTGATLGNNMALRLVLTSPWNNPVCGFDTYVLRILSVMFLVGAVSFMLDLPRWASRNKSIS